MPAPPSDGEANTPVSSAPTMPPTPCTPNTSSASSAPSMLLQPGHAPQAERGRPAKPITIAPHRADEAAGRGDGHQARHRARGRAQHRGLALASIHSAKVQASTAAAVAMMVLMKASAGDAVGLEVGAGVEAEPAHPQQRGADHGQRQAVRGHRLAAVAHALAQHVGAHQARPRAALMCTTVPPAKSSAPLAHSQPAAAVDRIGRASWRR
jgi:hypothetical protein